MNQSNPVYKLFHLAEQLTQHQKVYRVDVSPQLSASFTQHENHTNTGVKLYHVIEITVYTSDCHRQIFMFSNVRHDLLTMKFALEERSYFGNYWIYDNSYQQIRQAQEIDPNILADINIFICEIEKALAHPNHTINF